MRNRVIKLSLLLAVMVALTTNVDAQQKKPVRAKSKRATTTKTTNRSNNAKNTTALTAPAKDTVPVAPPPIIRISHSAVFFKQLINAFLSKSFI